MDDPQQRIAELERQLAEAKAAAGPNQAMERPAPVSAAQMEAIDEHARPLAQALPAERRNPFAARLTPVREALSRAESGVRTACAAPSRGRGGAGWIGPVIAMLGGVIGLCVGAAAAVTAVIPSTALWMSPIVCRGGYEMVYNTAHYSYKPGQSGTSVSFQCVGDGDLRRQ